MVLWSVISIFVAPQKGPFTQSWAFENGAACCTEKICVRACLFLHPKWSRYAKFYGSGSEKLFDKQHFMQFFSETSIQCGRNSTTEKPPYSNSSVLFELLIDHLWRRLKKLWPSNKLPSTPVELAVTFSIIRLPIFMLFIWNVFDWTIEPSARR